MSGAVLYLVSACSTAEEFVAAFRRYADRTGVFIPTSTPLPSGRRARVALTLVNGGVMLEGDADIVQSSAKPTVLQGRPGMTVKFVAPDEPSKTVLAELEKARLALKPAPPSVAPRPADIPAEPRPTPPPTGGRIDAANALAECVVIGDTNAALSSAPGPAIPAIPALGTPRPATPSTPPPSTSAPAPRAKPVTIPPISGGIPTVDSTATARPRTNSSRPTSIGMPVMDKLPAAPAAALAGVVTDDESTMIGEVPPKPPAAAKSGGGVPRRTASFETQPVSIGRVAPPVVPDAPRAPATPTGRGKPPTRPPLQPRHPTPVAPVPIVRPPAKRALVDDAIVENVIVEEEKTDLNEVPVSGERTAVTAPPVPPGTPSGDVPAQAAEAAEPVDPLAATNAKPGRSGGMRASEIMAAIPTGDWTMAPDAPEPTPLAEPATEPPKGPPTGNWTISLDPETGWSEPKKVEQPAPPPPTPPRARQVSSGNPTITVAKDEGFVAVAQEDKPTHIGDKIEIDASLMDEAAAAANPAPPRPPAPPSLAPRPPAASAPSNGVARAGFTEHADYSGAAALPPRKKQPAWLLPVGAAVALAAGFGLVMLLSGGKSKHASPSSSSKTTGVPAAVTKPAVPVDAAVVEAVAPAPPAEPEPPSAPATGGPCKVTVSSTPAGANIFLGDEKLGTTPADLELPCGVEARLSIRKASFSTASRTFTPVDGKDNKVTIKLAKPTLTVKVISSPPGATITVGGKSMGVTPASVRLPANEPAELVLTKPGFAVTRTSVTPKTNNSSTSVTLKKGKR